MNRIVCMLGGLALCTVVACAAIKSAEPVVVAITDAACKELATPTEDPFVAIVCDVVDATGRVVGSQTVTMPRQQWTATRAVTAKVTK